ncbi:MAG: hypothetical protein H0T79_19515 [Deltaproteobacteria bacterium]|nr:hypothetical protein [Deltaproteobacteria bacterium]
MSARLLLLIASAGCTLSTAYGDAVRSTGPSTNAPAPDTRSADTLPESPGVRRARNTAPYPTAPADPWAAVANDQPIHMSEEASKNWYVRTEPFACTAAADHCFLPGVWLVEQDAVRERPYRYAIAFGIGQEYLVSPPNSRASGAALKAITAYRTVPATKRHLVPGAMAMFLKFPDKHPRSGEEVFETSWSIGIVERVDWDMGFVFFVGQKDQAWISGVRVPVLAWRPGGKVTIVDGRKRDQLGVAVSEVTLP